jgi:hypothetical protein
VDIAGPAHGVLVVQPNHTQAEAGSPLHARRRTRSSPPSPRRAHCAKCQRRLSRGQPRLNPSDLLLPLPSSPLASQMVSYHQIITALPAARRLLVSGSACLTSFSMSRRRRSAGRRPSRGRAAAWIWARRRIWRSSGCR